MSSTSKSQNTVPFSHVAAGHEGISTSADGTLLIKPCTAAEIAFYEAARAHPNLQAHLPIFMGSLTLNDSPEEQVAVGVLRNARTRRDSTGAEVPVDPSAGHIVSDPKIESTPTKQWTPSGGAKLKSNLSIVLSNATSGFVKPNIIDLKLGARLWDDDAPQAKRTKLDEVSQSSTSSSLGFRVAGMKVYVGDQQTSDEVSREVNTIIDNGYKTYDKMYGRSNMLGDGSNIVSAFEAFFYSLNSSPRSESNEDAPARVAARKHLLLSRLLREIESIQFVLENEESRMYSASILMVYEGDPDALDSVLTYTPAASGTQSQTLTCTPKSGVDPIFTTSSHDDDGADRYQDVEESEDPNAVDVEDDSDDGITKQKIHEIVLIDFAHAHFVPGEGPDENALRGVRSVRRILEGFLGKSG